MTAPRWFRPRIAVIVVPVAALFGVVAAVLILGSEPSDPTGRKAGHKLASALATFAATANEVRAPFPCAELGATFGQKSGREVIARIGSRAVVREGHTVTVDTGSKKPIATLGVIADTRGASTRTLAQLGEIRAAFSEAEVDLVISLGGIADNEADLAAVYGALAAHAPWPVLAIPGDRAPVLAHRQTIADLNESNRGVLLDGSDVRLVHIGPATIATFPGVAEPAQLPAGDRGCVHGGDEANAIAQLLAAADGIKIWAGYAPPRQIGAAGSDVARGGIHVGERILSGAIQRSGAALVLHGLLDEAALAARRGEGTPAKPAFVAAGSAAALPVVDGRARALRGSALVVTVEQNRVRWRRVAIHLAPGG